MTKLIVAFRNFANVPNKVDICPSKRTGWFMSRGGLLLQIIY
jgi:hypothetical protein